MTIRRSVAIYALLSAGWVAALATACGGPDFVPYQGSDAGGIDAIADVPPDLPPIVCAHCNNPPPPDAGTDADTDATVPPDERGADSGVETGAEANVDTLDAATAAADDGAVDAADTGTCLPPNLACDERCLSPTDIHSCGSCTNDCTLLSNVSAAGLACASGRCSYQCVPGYGDCADSGAGCHTLLESTTNCGACGTACGSTAPLCAQVDAGSYACASGCTIGAMNCGGTCSNLTTDQNNCGACGTLCLSGATCTSGACQCDTTREPRVAACVIDNAYGVFVAPTANGGSDTTGDGSMAKPFATIGKALSNPSGKSRVYVCDATFSEQVTITSPVSLYGGLACPNGTLGPPWSYVGGIVEVNSPSAAFALSVSNVSTAITIEDMSFAAPSRSVTDRDGSGNGNSSIAALIAGSNVTMRRVTLNVGKGADGTPGADGTSSPNYSVSSATAPSGSSGTVFTQPYADAGTASIAGPMGGSIVCNDGDTSSGGEGGTASYNAATHSNSVTGGSPGTAAPATTANGTRNGQGGAGECVAAVPTDDGADGSARTAGGAATVYGALTSGGWTVTVGSDGQAGAPGQGGGGAGGYQGGPNELISGSSGGAGGCGGAGGKAGRSGGGSIALASLGSLVTLTSCTLTTGGGGAGGQGGAGQDGQSGGAGGPTPGNASCGPGGTGGNGAGGSGGAGGSAGISAGIAFTGMKPTYDSSTIFTLGSGGTPGNGGAAGAAGANALGTGNAGNPGAAGLAWTPTSVLGPL